ncbi:hypothetical protein [Parapedobacter sp. DT-150]|uniref:hypothetical protein n=1 Tax=Parapedobacter sp. DT-150 TaxID=3396162 RepID=UPI003F1E299E
MKSRQLISSVVLSEQSYIALCRRQIEEKFAFGNGSGYTQRDLELLARHIEEKTGIVLSLSTLKRFWKDDFKQRPQLATLNAWLQYWTTGTGRTSSCATRSRSTASRLKRAFGWALFRFWSC